MARMLHLIGKERRRGSASTLPSADVDGADCKLATGNCMGSLNTQLVCDDAAAASSFESVMIDG